MTLLHADPADVLVQFDNPKFHLNVVGMASRGHRPYLRLGGEDDEYLASLDVEEMRELRDALTRALRGWKEPDSDG